METRNDKILWTDCIGGICVGIIVLVIHRFLSQWENLPVAVIIAMGCTNLLYGSYSFYVTTRNPRPRVLVSVLAAANMFWLLVCIGIVVSFRRDISALGILLVLGEGVYVSLLGFTEWRWRDALSGNR